jgi:TolA-binding protein
MEEYYTIQDVWATQERKASGLPMTNKGTGHIYDCVCYDCFQAKYGEKPKTSEQRISQLEAKVKELEQLISSNIIEQAQTQEAPQSIKLKFRQV